MSTSARGESTDLNRDSLVLYRKTWGDPECVHKSTSCVASTIREQRVRKPARSSADADLAFFDAHLRITGPDAFQEDEATKVEGDEDQFVAARCFITLTFTVHRYRRAKRRSLWSDFPGGVIVSCARQHPVAGLTTSNC